MLDWYVCLIAAPNSTLPSEIWLCFEVLASIHGGRGWKSRNFSSIVVSGPALVQKKFQKKGKKETWEKDQNVLKHIWHLQVPLFIRWPCYFDKWRSWRVVVRCSACRGLAASYLCLLPDRPIEPQEESCCEVLVSIGLVPQMAMAIVHEP